jgi:hypothetical protein
LLRYNPASATELSFCQSATLGASCAGSDDARPLRPPDARTDTRGRARRRSGDDAAEYLHETAPAPFDWGDHIGEPVTVNGLAQFVAQVLIPGSNDWS